MVNFICSKCMANDAFSEPPRRADSRNPIFIFCLFLGLGHLRGPGVSLGRILGDPSIEPLLGGGGASQGALLNPPPSPSIESPSTPACLGMGTPTYRPAPLSIILPTGTNAMGGGGPGQTPPPPSTPPPLSQYIRGWRYLNYRRVSQCCGGRYATTTTTTTTAALPGSGIFEGGHRAR